MDRLFFVLGSASGLVGVAAGAFGAHVRWPGSPVRAAGWCFAGGTVLFSGSLYALSLSGGRWPSGITPLGGLAFRAGWACLIWAAGRGTVPQGG